MKIVVCVKFVPDTAIKVRVSPDKKRVELADVTFVVNPYDEFAVEDAVKRDDPAEALGDLADGDEGRGHANVIPISGGSHSVIVMQKRPASATSLCITPPADPSAPSPSSRGSFLPAGRG